MWAGPRAQYVTNEAKRCGRGATPLAGRIDTALPCNVARPSLSVSLSAPSITDVLPSSLDTRVFVLVRVRVRAVTRRTADVERLCVQDIPSL